MRTQNIYDPKLFWDEKARRAGLNFEAAVCLDDPGMNKIIDKIQKILLRKAVEQISQRIDLSGKKILDYGCGTGRWIEFFRSYGLEYTGVDLSTEMVRIASERYPDAIFAPLSNKGIQYPSKSFDIVSSIAVIHHNPYKEQTSILNEICRIINLKGFFVLFESISPPDQENILEFPRSVADWSKALECNGLKQLWIEKTRYFTTQKVINRLTGSNRFYSLSKKLGYYFDPYIPTLLPSHQQTRAIMLFQKIT